MYINPTPTSRTVFVMLVRCCNALSLCLFYIVTLSLVGKDVCPSQSVTVRCVVKRPSNQQSPFLSWRCSGSVNENLVICNPILDFNCEFGKVVNVTGSCECEDTVIVSEATFIPNTDSAGNLTCGNGVQEETVSLSVKGKTTQFAYPIHVHSLQHCIHLR